MTTWILIIALWTGSNAGQTVVIQNLESYQECVRVDKEMRSLWDDATSPSFGKQVSRFAKSKCIEVKVKK